MEGLAYDEPILLGMFAMFDVFAVLNWLTWLTLFIFEFS